MRRSTHAGTTAMEGNDRLQSVLNSIDMIAVQGYRPDGTVTFWNKASEHLYGFTADEMAGKDIVECVIAPEARAEERRLMAEAVRTGQPPSSGELPITRNDGSAGRVYANRVLITLQGKEPEFFCFAVDLTEHRAIENALRQSETQFRTLFDLFPFACVVTDIEGRYTLVNQAFLLHTGYTVDEVLGRTAVEVGLLDTEEPWNAAIAQLKSKGYMLDTEIVAHTKTGETKHVLTCSRRLGDDTPIILTVTVDITEQKRANETIRRSESKYRTLFETAQDAILIVEDGRFVECNTRALDLFRCTREQIIGKTPQSLSPPQQPDGFDTLQLGTEKLRAAIDAPPQRFEWLHCACDGTPFTAEVSLTRVMLDDKVQLMAIVHDITERKRTEEALRRSDEKYRNLFDTLSDSVFITDCRWHFIEVNSSSCRQLGYTHDELLALSVSDISFTTDSVLETFRATLARESSVTYETVHRRKNGTTLSVEVVVKPISHEGQPAFMGVARDITKRKRTEEALREKTNEIERYFSTALDLFCIADVHGFFRKLNAQWEETLGYTLDELLGKRFIDFVHPDDVEPTQKVLAHLSAQHEVLNFVNRYRCKNGSYRWIEWRSAPQNDTIYAAARDITDRKRIEEALQFTQFAVDHIADAAFWMRPDGRFFYVNEAACRALGYSQDELLGMAVPDIDPDVPPDVMTILWRRLKTKGCDSFETSHRTKDGRIFPVEIHSNLIEVDGHEYNCAFARDITARKQAEEAFRQRNDELTALNQLMRAVISQASLNDVCRVAVQQVADALSADMVALFVREEDDLRLFACAPEPPCLSIDSTPLHRVGECLCGLAVQTVHPIYVADATDDPRCTWKDCRDAGLCSVAAIPLRLGDQAVGVLTVGALRRRDFETVARYLETAADQLAAGIHNAQLLEQTRAYAAKLQQAIAERDLSETALRKRQKEVIRANLMLKNVLDTIPVRVFWKDRDSRYLGCNTLFARDAGFERPEQVVGKDDYAIGSHDGADRFRNDDRAVIESGLPRIGYEEPQPRNDGTMACLRTSKIPLRNVDGDVVGVLGTYEDITAQKLAEEALRNSENRLREAVTRFSGILFQFCVRANDTIAVYYVSEQTETIFGVSPDLDGFFERVTAAVLPEFRDEFVKSLMTAVRNTSDWSFEGRAQLPAGRIIHFTTSASPVRRGDELVFSGVMLDVTQLRRAEEERALNVQRTHVLLQLNQMRDESLAEITAFALEEAVQLTQSRIGYLAFLNDDESILTMHSWSKNAMDECAIIDKPLSYPVDSTGLWGEAVRQRKPVITNDYAAPSPYKKGCPEGHVPIQRHMNVPIFAGARIVLVAGVGDKTEEYDQDDVQQLTLLMEGMWHLIERKKADEALRSFKHLVEYSSDAIGMSTPDGRHYYQNEAFGRLFGNPGDFPRDTIYADRAVGKHVFDITTGGRSWQGEIQMLAKDGAILDIFLRTYPIRDQEASIIGLVGLYTDITNRKRTEEESIRLASIVRHSRELINLAAPDGTLVFLNDTGKAMLGLSEDAIPQTNLMQVIPEPLHAKIRHELLPTLLARGFWEGDMQYCNVQSGALTDVHAIAFRIDDPKTGELRFLANVSQDITERKRAELEKETLESQLRQAQKMEAVGQLAGGIAHDFNNLLQAIMGYTEIVQAHMDPDGPDADTLEEVRKAAQRAADLTRQLLAFSRRQVIKPVNMDLNELVQGILKMVRRVIGEHIELRYIPAQSLGTICADKGQIEQVLMNLCVNARDAMPTGGVLTLKTENASIDDEYCRYHPWAAPGRYALLSITDTGCGMDETTRALIFEPFFTTKDVGHGTGLGLATVYGIVTQHNGLIHVYSEPGMGSTFRVYLPTVDTAADSTPATIETPVVGGTETILVAEDEAMVRNLVCQILRNAGYTVLVACDGEDAVKVFKENAESIDMALLDVMMPKLGGRQVMDYIHAQCPRMRFLFSSGYSEDAIHTHFVIEDDVRLIAKPYRRADLLRAIRTTLDASPSA